MSGITTYKSRGGNQVELSNEMVYRIIGKGNDKLDEMDLTSFVALCHELRLNPFVPGEVYLVKYDTSKPAQIVVGKQAFIRIAEENPNYINRKSGVTILNKDKEIEHRVGSAVYPPLSEELLGGWCTVSYKRPGHDAVEERTQRVAIQEYNTNKSLWANKPGTMIEKVAVVQCLRETFPNDYKGAYSEEEIIPAGEVPKETEIVYQDQQITQVQRKELFTYAKLVYGDSVNDKLMEVLQVFGHNSTNNIRESELAQIYDYICNNQPQEVQELHQPEVEDYCPDYPEED